MSINGDNIYRQATFRVPRTDPSGSQLDSKITVDTQWMDIHSVKHLCNNEFHQDKTE